MISMQKVLFTFKALGLVTDDINAESLFLFKALGLVTDDINAESFIYILGSGAG